MGVFAWTTLLVVIAILGLIPPLPARALNCDPNAMTREMSACGFDLDCISRVTNDYNSSCLGETEVAEPSELEEPDSTAGTGSPEVDGRIAECGMDVNCLMGLMQEVGQGAASVGGSGGGGGGSGGSGAVVGVPGMPSGMGDMLKQFQACGNDRDCLKNFQEQMGGSQENSSGPDSPDFDTTGRIGETSILPAAWLQSYQEALVNCEGNGQCHAALFMGAGQAKIAAHCPSNMMNPWSAVCRMVAQNELLIEQAIAAQRLRQQGILIDQNSVAAIRAGMPSVSSPGTAPEVAEQLGEGVGLQFVPEVTAVEANQILARWERKLEGSMPQEARDRIMAAVAVYPLEAAETTPFLVFEETENEHGSHVDAKPTRRDYAFSLIGTLLTDAGMEIGGADGKMLLDSAFWSLIQAAKLQAESIHFTGIGFHCNLRAELEDGRDILAYAAKLDPENADSYHNLAFSYSALGKGDDAIAIQQHALRLDPASDDIRSRLNAMLEISGGGNDSGGDFGEAFFRLSKRHILREYQAGMEWWKARDLTEKRMFGGNPAVPGPNSYYAEQLRDLEDDYRACQSQAPEILRGCAMGAFILHPSCDDAPDQAQVERSRHNYDAHMCQCRSNYIMAKADAVSAYLNACVVERNNFEKNWWPKLNWYAKTWSEDIRNINAMYAADSLQYPVESAYWEWRNEFLEDSEEVWANDIPDIARKWDELKTEVQNLKVCKTKLPPLEKKPKAELPEPEEKETSYGINLIVFELKMTMSGDLKASFDLGVVKGGYARKAATDSHKFSIGSGPVEASYELGTLGKGRDHRLSVTMSTNFLKILPGGDLAGNLLSIGSKHTIQWGSRSGFRQSTTVESKAKLGFSVNRVPATSMRN